MPEIRAEIRACSPLSYPLKRKMDTNISIMTWIW